MPINFTFPRHWSSSWNMDCTFVFVRKIWCWFPLWIFLLSKKRSDDATNSQWPHFGTHELMQHFPSVVEIGPRIHNVHGLAHWYQCQRRNQALPPQVACPSEPSVDTLEFTLTNYPKRFFTKLARCRFKICLLEAWPGNTNHISWVGDATSDSLALIC